LILSSAPWSIGAYGEGKWAASQPAGQYTGVAINMLKTVGTKLDLLNIMSYDASNAYNPKEALDAYRNYFKGDVVLGVEVANEAWGGHVTSIPEVEGLADYVKSSGGAGMMLWSVQKPADAGPTGTQISQSICNKFGLSKCTCGMNCPPV
jgi:chitinase